MRECSGPHIMTQDLLAPRFLTELTLEDIRAKLSFSVQEQRTWPSDDGQRWLHVIAQLPN